MTACPCLPVAPTHKRCPRCAGVKPLGAFPRDRSRASGIFPYCLDCSAARMRERRAEPDRRRCAVVHCDRPRQVRDLCESCASRARRYGLSHVELVRFLLDPTCDICGVDVEVSAQMIDHDHATGAVRGLLCRRCNIGLGWFGDTDALIRRALTYLERGPLQSHPTAEP